MTEIPIYPIQDINHGYQDLFCLVCGLTSHSTALVIPRWPVNLPHFFPGQA